MELSYRLIAVLYTYKRIIEEWLKKNLTKYLDKENIILDNYHGGHANHSTVSAKMVVDHFCQMSKDLNKLGVVLMTDLISAYDTVDHSTIMQKLESLPILGIEHIVM